MIPIGSEAARALLPCGNGLHRSVALRHAILRGCSGLWGNDPRRPTSVVWLRDGGTQREAFAAGFSTPALAWLAEVATGCRLVLAAPATWEPAVRARWEPTVRVERLAVQTWFRVTPTPLPEPVVPVRTLDRDDRAAFVSLTPPWSLTAWGGYTAMLTQGLAVGIPTQKGRGLAAAAWVVEADCHLAKVGVATHPRFQRLGLGRAVAATLIQRLEAAGRWQPLWVTHPGNTASMGLARSLGFRTPLSESILWWDSA